MTEAAALACRHGVRPHTHLAETLDEEEFCRERFGATPVEHMETLGWLGGDVWLAHAVHLSDSDVARLGATSTGGALLLEQRAAGRGHRARARDLRDAGVPVGLGVDGAASNEAGSLLEEVRHAVLFARARGGPRELTVRDALEMATVVAHGCSAGRTRSACCSRAGWPTSRCGGSTRWRTPGSTTRSWRWSSARRRRWSLLLVGGRVVVEADRLVTVDEDAAARDAETAGRRCARGPRHDDDHHEGPGAH